jgi:hypothetical protein
MANNTAYGFTSLESLYGSRVSEVGVGRIFDAVQESAAEYNRVMVEMLGQFVERTTTAQEQIELPGDGTLQPLDEWGNPIPVQPSGNYQVAYPIQGAGTAWGTNRVSRALLTVEEANRYTVDALQRDADWVIRHLLGGIFTNTTWTFSDKAAAGGYKGLGNITIQPLANGDSVTYVKRGAAAAATDSHYLAQANAISDSDNPFPTIRAELIEHPTNSGPFVCYVPSGLTDTIAGLTEFVEVSDPDIRYGASSDTLSANQAAILGPGDEILGKTKSSNIWVVEWDYLPANYMIALATGGRGGPVLKMREYPAAELQGLFPETNSPDGNLQEMRMIRYAGFGAHNRVKALAYRIGNASYAIPSGFSAPLAV